MHADAARQRTTGVEALEVDIHPPLNRHEARVEADRCYFCHDAPCVTACPTGIDIPLFIRQISTGNPSGAAKTIFDENIFGGMCARVCPTETLCEEACVRNLAEEKPVTIGLLQRYSTDHQMATGKQPYQRAPLSGKKVAVVGAGPAGIACAHRLAMHGHDVVVFEAQEKSGGLNEYGIAAYKTIDDFAQQELQYILSIGGIDVRHGQELGRDITLAKLKEDYAAVFVGAGLNAVNTLVLDGAATDTVQGVEDAVEFIARLRQSANPADISVGRQVVVVGGGMTAIDAAVQSRMLGAEDVTVFYRRGQTQMNASAYEQQLAQTHGVLIKPWRQPVGIIQEAGRVTGVEFEITTEASGTLEGTGERVTAPADQVLMAIGQQLDTETMSDAGLKLDRGRIEVDPHYRTSDPQVWAGGDCITDGTDLTVAAVQHGKLAAESIHATLSQG